VASHRFRPSSLGCLHPLPRLTYAVPFYALNAVELALSRHRDPCQQGGVGGGGGLVRLWRRLGVPRRAKFDNGQIIQGRGRQLAVPVWTCLALGVRVRFIPFAEPWRNPVTEHFNPNRASRSGSPFLLLSDFGPPSP
jgi:hypothetical protein